MASLLIVVLLDSLGPKVKFLSCSFVISHYTDFSLFRPCQLFHLVLWQSLHLLDYSFYYLCPEFVKRIFGMFWMGYIDCKVNQALPRPLIIDPLLKGCIVCHKSIPKGSKLDQKSNRYYM